MKAKFLLLILSTFFVGNAQSKHGIVGESNWFSGWTNFNPKKIEYDKPTNILNGVITENTTLSKRNTYVLMGMVYVANNAVLTIEPGTVIRGDFESCGSLVVTKGAKIIAEGTVTDPIIFTSNKSTSERKPGDWGGVMLMGDAPLNAFGGVLSSIYDPNPLYNTFGGNNENSDSGILKYVRIEFAGKKVREKVLLNGLTLAAVGNKTKVEYVQVSFSNDDSYEFVGGNANVSNLISFKANDDDFDLSFGVQSTINNTIAIRYPYTSDNTRSRCFEIDSYDKVANYDTTKKLTVVKLNNVTMVSNEVNEQGLVKEAISLKSDSFLEMNNCAVVGFASFMALDDKYLDGDNFKKIKVRNSTIDSCKEMFTNENLFKAENVNNWFNQKDKFVNTSSVGIDNLFMNNDIKKKPDFRIK
jgi:hypothetical protein